MSETREIAERLVLDALNGRVIKQVNAFVKDCRLRLMRPLLKGMSAQSRSRKHTKATANGVATRATAKR